jgi:hypothetical protein
MGKANRRKRNQRVDPTGKSIKPPSDPELAAIREQRILPLLKDLQSAESKKRSTAASLIANIIEDSRCRKLLLREQIVRILFEQTLTDSNLETRTAGWGILRNLALEEEGLGLHLFRQDILTAIEGVVRTVSHLSACRYTYANVNRSSKPSNRRILRSRNYQRPNRNSRGISQAQ